MTTEKRTTQGPAVRFIFSPDTLGGKDVSEAIDVLNGWKEKGAVKEIDLEQGVIRATDQRRNYTLDYSISEEGKEDYRLYWEPDFGMPVQEFMKALISAIAFFLGRYVLASIQGFIRDVKKILGASREDFDPCSLEQPRMVREFLLLLPTAVLKTCETMADAIDRSLGREKSLPRKVPDVWNFLVLDQSEQAFWKNVPGIREKALFYPFHLYLLVVSVVPTRPLEFLATPFDCLSQCGGEWILTMRKTLLKGHQDYKGYSLQDDFMEVRYFVPDFIAQEITAYKAFLASLGLEPGPLGTLLAPALHYYGLGRESTSAYYSYANLSYVFRRFQETLIPRYGYELGSPAENDAPAASRGSTVEYIHPGDYRHVTLFNIISEGVSGHLAKEIAGHLDINDTMWYASNNRFFGGSATYTAYTDSAARNCPIKILPDENRITRKKNARYIEVCGGRCYSEALVYRGDPRDCLFSNGKDLAPDNCRECRFFVAGEGQANKETMFRSSVDMGEDWGLLRSTYERYRQDVLGKGAFSELMSKAEERRNVLTDMVRRGHGISLNNSGASGEGR